MRILIGSPTSAGIGGIARHVQGLTNFLKSDGHYVEIISSENTFTIPIRKLKNPSFMISAYLKSTFKKNFDIVHAQGPPAAFALKNASGKKILSLHGIHHQQVKFLHGDSAGALAEKYEKFAFEWADIVTVSSKEMMDYYEQKGYKTEFFPNAIDVDTIPKGEDRKFEKQVVYAARLSKEKGISEVIKMAENLPEDIHLLILGSGSEENRVKDLSDRKSNVHFLGYQNKEKTISIIRGSDLLIQPSIFEGGLSYTLLESMACKTPIICTNVGGGKDFLNHMENAYLIPPENDSELLSAIMELFSDEKKRLKLSNSAYESVKNFSWNKIGKKYVELYESLISK